jgi:hypothetical protein
MGVSRRKDVRRQGHQKTVAYMSKPEGRRSVDRSKMRWLDDVEEDLRMMRISGWRGKARRRDERKSVLREVKVLQGP